MPRALCYPLTVRAVEVLRDVIYIYNGALLLCAGIAFFYYFFALRMMGTFPPQMNPTVLSNECTMNLIKLFCQAMGTE
jgi:hypothetical protein